MASYRMRMVGSKSAEIYLYDEIGIGYYGNGITAKQFADDLKSLGKIDTLNLRVNSPGGDVFDGVAIFNVLKRHPAEVIVDIDGMALSIASVIVMAGDRINIAKNAMLMIHDPWAIAGGTAEDLRAKADLMDQVKENLVTTYADRTRMDAGRIVKLMSAETWMKSQEAVANGFVDNVTEDLALAARFDLSRFRNAPKDLPKTPPIPACTDLFRAKIAAMASRSKQLSGQ